jgi:multiple sugar transport system permease protein
MIDGAGWFTTFFRIILPISRPALLTLALFTFQGEWNAFMWPLIVLNSPENFTLPWG